MNQFTSEAIPNPTRAEQAGFQRADLVFYGVDHSGPSYEARIFLNNPDAGLSTARDAEARFAGSFTVFGHAGCAGDVGHCDVPTGPRDPFDLRPSHALTPQTKTVIVTAALRALTDDLVTVTLVPVRPGRDGAELVDTLQFDYFRLLTYV